MGSFESPDESSHPLPPQPSWQQPMFVLPATVAVDLLVIRTDRVAITIGPIRTYPTGFDFTIDTHMHHGLDMRRYIGLGGTERPTTPDRGPRALRIDLLYADGRQGNSTGPWPGPGEDVAPNALVMMGGGATGSQYGWHSWFWVHPLPPPGPIAFHVAWPAYDIPETLVEIEGSLIREAAPRAITLWPDDQDEPTATAAPDP